MPERDTPLPGTFALICPETGAGIRFSPAPWPGLPEEVEVHTRKRHGAWGRHGFVSQARARELWRQYKAKSWETNNDSNSR